MQLLYGNDGINYHTIAKSKDMTESQEKELLSGYLGYDFVWNAEAYSSPEKEPVSLVYATTNLSNNMSEEKILLGRIGRMSNYATPSYWAHFQFRDITPRLYGEEFQELLRQSFIADTELNDYLSKDIDTFQSERLDFSMRTQAVEQDKLLVIVAAVLSVADSLSKQVKLVLDVEGDGYNERALEILASVYEYLPYNVRRRAGFSTYIGPESKSSNRIKLQLYTREALKGLGEEAFDLKNMDVQALLHRLPQDIVLFARDIVTQDEKIRKEWFRTFQTVFGVEAVSVEDHIRFYKNIRKWQTQELDALTDEAALYALQEITGEKTTPVFRIFCNIFDKRFVGEQYVKHYWEKLEAILKNQKDFRFSQKLMAYIALGEALPSVTLPHEVFLEWEQHSIVRPFEAAYEETALIQAYKEAYRQLCGIPSVGDKFCVIRNGLEETLKECVKAVQAEIQRRKDQEKEKCIRFFDIWEPRQGSLSRMEEIYGEIRYEENKAVFSQKLYEQTELFLHTIPCFKCLEDYRAYCDLLKILQTYLSAEQSNALQKLAEEKGWTVEAMEKLRLIEWNQRGDILKSYQNISDMRALSEKAQIAAPDYVLSISEHNFHLKEQEILILMQFLLSPGEKSSGKSEKLLTGDNALLEALMGIEAFGSEHFKCLLENAADERKRREILCYYIETERLLTREQVGLAIGKGDYSVLSDAIPEKDQQNILAAVIEECSEKKTVSPKTDTKSKSRHKKRRELLISIVVGILVCVAEAIIILALAGVWNHDKTGHSMPGGTLLKHSQSMEAVDEEPR